MADRIGRMGTTGPPRKGGALEAIAGGRAVSAESGKDVMVEGAVEVTLEELREFLDGDQVEVRANPAFKERLRDRLWALVQERSRRFRGDRS
jgi:hypothetical protein